MYVRREKDTLIELRIISTQRNNFSNKYHQFLWFDDFVLLLQYYITDRWLLVKTSLVLVGVILCFFLHSFIDDMHIDLGTKPSFLFR